MAKKKSNTKKAVKAKEKAKAEKNQVEEKQPTEQQEESIETDGSSDEINLKAKVDELNDKYTRLYSEFDNFRRRTLKEKLELSKTASEEIITELLPIIDDFERAIKSSKELENCNAITEGIELIYNKLMTTLQKKGLAPVDAMEKEFDTDFHEAVTYIPAPNDKLKGKVVDVLEKGYLLHEKVIRYAKVVLGQ